MSTTAEMPESGHLTWIAASGMDATLCSTFNNALRSLEPLGIDAANRITWVRSLDMGAFQSPLTKGCL